LHAVQAIRYYIATVTAGSSKHQHLRIYRFTQAPGSPTFGIL